MTSKTTLVNLTMQALIGNTDAGNNVFSVLDQSTWEGEYPVLFLSAPLDEDGESFGRNSAPAFTVTSSLTVEGRVTERALSEDGGAKRLMLDLARLRDQIKGAVINYGPLMGELQQFAFFKVRGVPGPDDAGEHVGTVSVEIGFEYVQGPDEFRPVPSTPLDTLTGTVGEPEGTTEPFFSITLPTQ